MKSNRKSNNWLAALFSFSAEGKRKMIGSGIASLISVVGGFVPYLCLYQILHHFIFEMPRIGVLLWWNALAALSCLVHYIFFGLSTSLSHSAAYQILVQLRRAIADRLMKAPLGHVVGDSIGRLKNTMVEQVEGIERPLAHMVPELGANLILAFGVVGYLFTIDWRMGIASMITLPVAAIPMVLTNRDFEEKYAAYREASDRINSVIVEYVRGIEVVKTFNQSTRSYEKYAEAVLSYKDFILDWFRSSWKGMNLILSILPTTFLGTLPVGLLLYRSGDLSSVELMMCLILALSMLPVFIRATAFITEMKSMKYNVLGALELLNIEILPDAATVADRTDTANISDAVEATAAHTRADTLIDSADIRFDGVSFSYSGDPKDRVLHRLDFHVPKASFTAIVGPSGGGKSTIAKLIARFWDVSEGSISICGVDVRQIPLTKLSRLVSFVTQDNFLFDCSIFENIRLGKPGASPAEVEAAAKAACCHDFILKLNRGYETPAGEAGKLLSGGEKQRISIARAILKDAPILLLDEATAFTDPQSEEQIQQSIAALTKGKTLLVIAHRLSTIQHADQILVLSEGNLVESGKHEDLLAQGGLYRSMWKAHIGSKQWTAAKGGRQ